MKPKAGRSIPTYSKCFAAQVGALGAAGQDRLRRAAVLIAGAGGLGTAVSSILASAGVGRLVLADPQRMEVDNFNRYPFARVSDIGKPKVDIVTAFLDGRPHLNVVPIFDRAESTAVKRAAEDVDLVMSASNTVSSRIALARIAVRLKLAHVSGAVVDGRDGLGGSVAIWVPERSDLACPACFLTPEARPRRGESLVAPVVSTVGAFAACLAIQLLAAADRASLLQTMNYLTLDVAHYTLGSLRVFRRQGCPACGGVRR